MRSLLLLPVFLAAGASVALAAALPGGLEFPTGLYAVTEYKNGSAYLQEGKVCIGRRALAEESSFGGLERFIDPGCEPQVSVTRPAPGRLVEAICKPKDGSASTRLRIEQTDQDFRISATRDGSGGAAPAVSMDVSYHRVGDCPTGMKPGELLLDGGEIVDPLAWLTSLFSPGAPAPKPDPIPPAPDVPESAIGPVNGYQVVCTPVGGRLWATKKQFPFGSGDQRWEARPQLGVSPDGELLVFSSARSESYETQKGKDVRQFSREPHYTIRIGKTYVFTPPIAQQDGVSSMGNLMSGRDAARRQAREEAEAKGETYCSLGSGCFLGKADKEAFLGAFEQAAKESGELRVSAMGPEGIVTVRFPLKGLSGIANRLRACPSTKVP